MKCDECEDTGIAYIEGGPIVQCPNGCRQPPRAPVVVAAPDPEPEPAQKTPVLDWTERLWTLPEGTRA